jgi:hypothetical protein
MGRGTCLLRLMRRVSSSRLQAAPAALEVATHRAEVSETGFWKLAAAATATAMLCYAVPSERPRTACFSFRSPASTRCMAELEACNTGQDLQARDTALTFMPRSDAGCRCTQSHRHTRLPGAGCSTSDGALVRTCANQTHGASHGQTACASGHDALATRRLCADDQADRSKARMLGCWTSCRPAAAEMKAMRRDCVGVERDEWIANLRQHQHRSEGRAGVVAG